MNKFRLLLSLGIAVAATLFTMRLRSLRELEAQQAQLHHQIGHATKLQAAIARANTTNPAPAGSGLSAAERSELLRLRGEIGLLRQEIAQEADEPAKGAMKPARAVAAAESREPLVTKSQAMVKMNQGRQWVLALLLHAEANAGRLPATLAEAAKFAGSPEGADEFELIAGGDLQSVKAPGTIWLREKRPWKSADGRWNRGYGFADGHVEIAQSPNEDFSEWEQKKTVQATPPPGR